MRITTRYYRAKWDDDPYRSKIKAYAETGESLAIYYPYTCDDPDWKVAYSLARGLGYGEVTLVQELGWGKVYEV